MDKLQQRPLQCPTDEEIFVLIAAGTHARDLAADCRHDFAAYLFDMAVETLQNDLICPKSTRQARTKLPETTTRFLVANSR